MVSRLRSRKSIGGSTRELQSSKQEQQELNMKVVMLEKQVASQKSEIDRLVLQLKDQADHHSRTKNTSKVLAENIVCNLVKLLEKGKFQAVITRTIVNYI